MRKSIIIALSMLVLSACTKDNNGTNGDGKDDITYTVTYNSGLAGCDNLLFYDFKISYKDAKGNLVEEKVTEYPFTKEVKEITAPFTAGITPVYTLKAKDEIKTDKESFKICGLNISVSLKGSDGSFEGGSVISSQTLPFEKAYEYVSRNIERYSNKTVETEITKKQE